MSQQLRQLKSRIRSVEGTWKVTRAMEMVSMSKFKAVEAPLTMARAYFSRISSILDHLLEADPDAAHPYFKPSHDRAIGLVVITSDTGLCGAYTDEILRQADKFMDEHKGREIKLYVYGRKGQSHFRKEGIPVHRFFPVAHGRIQPMFHRELYEAIITNYNTGLLSEVHVCHTIYKTVMKHIPVTEKFLNIDRKPAQGAGDVIFENPSQGILADIIPVYLSNRLRLMMLESLTSEFSARMVAMKSAKDNAKELIGDLILLRNKIRQASITKEVIEIISSAEALKG